MSSARRTLNIDEISVLITQELNVEIPEAKSASETEDFVEDADFQEDENYEPSDAGDQVSASHDLPSTANRADY